MSFGIIVYVDRSKTKLQYSLFDRFGQIGYVKPLRPGDSVDDHFRSETVVNNFVFNIYSTDRRGCQQMFS